MKGGEIMKRITLLLVLIITLSLAAELPVWWFRGTDDWVEQTGSNTARCRKFGENAIAADTTNIVENVIDIDNYADVGQWMYFAVTGGTDITHYVRRPGIFVGKAFGLDIASNADVTMDFDGFANLTKDADAIPIMYAYDEGTWDDPSDISNDDWLTPSGLNSLTAVTIEEPTTYQFWQKITVANMAKRGIYKNENATITLTLQDQADWIDPLTGQFDFGK